MIIETDKISKENSIIESTTIKTIRNLKNKKCYTHIQSSSSRQDNQDLSDNTNQLHDFIIRTISKYQKEDNNINKSGELPRYPKEPSINSQIGRNPMRKYTQKQKVLRLQSDTVIGGNQGEDNIHFKEQIRNFKGQIRNGQAKSGSFNMTESSQLSSMENSLQMKINYSQSSLSNSNEMPQQKEYILVDMDYAIQFVLQKSKAFKVKIETEGGILSSFITTNITQNKFFHISYNSFLQSLISKKVLNLDFKNVSKKIFDKLEKFFLDRLQKCQQNVQIQQDYLKKSKGVYSALDKRIKELQKEAADKNKIEI